MIVNRSQLLSHGYSNLRGKAIDIIEYSLKNVDPYAATIKKLIRKRDTLNINNEISLDLNNYKNIYVVGAGKATYRIAMGLEEVIGDRITDGIIVSKDDHEKLLERIRIIKASHPIPDERSFLACKEIFKIADKADKNDLVFCLITGGSSSLCTYPISDITFQDKIDTNKILLNSGAEVKEINTIRKHLSQIKGGRLGLRILPARIINLTVSDGIGDSLEGNTDWTSPDYSTFKDVIEVIEKHSLWEKFPKRVVKFFEKFEQRKETPKFIGEKDRINSFMLIKTRELCEFAKIKAEQKGINTILLTSFLNGESKEVGKVLASIAREIKSYKSPIKPPCVIIAGGETTVKIEHSPGIGGPNQELTIGALLSLKNEEKIVIAALDSDGNDGSSQFAGALVDLCTINMAEEAKLDIIKILDTHNVADLLLKTGDVIITNATGTNVNDLILILIE